MTVPINPASGFARLPRFRSPPRRRTPVTQEPPIALPPGFGFGFAEGFVPDRQAYDCSRWPNRADCGGHRDRPPGDLSEIDSRDIVEEGFDGCQGWRCVRIPWGRGYLVRCFHWQFSLCPERFVPAEHGFTGIFPGRHLNRSPVGWIPNCQYFVHIQAEEGVIFPQTFTNYFRSNAVAWDPDRRNGWIFPAYGPIERLEWEPVFHPDGDIIGWDYYLVCNGLGLYGTQGPNRTSRRLVEFTQFNLDLNTWIFCAHFNIPRARPWNNGTAAFHEDIWIYSPGESIDRDARYEFVGFAEPKRRFLFNLNTPSLRIYRITPASEIAPHIYPPRGSYPFGGREWAAGQTATYGRSCTPVPPPPPPPIPPRPSEDPPMACCSCSEIEAIIRRKLRPIMQFMELSENAQQQAIAIAPETLIENAGQRIYSTAEPGSSSASTLKELVATVAASLYYRAGYHRFPAQVPSLTSENDGEQPTEINDAMSWQEWLVKELDGVLGKFPLKIQAEVEEDQDDGSTAIVIKEVNFPNLAEAIAELTGMLLNIADDANAAAEFSLRGMMEAGKAEVAALIAQDYAKANAQFLGYKGNPVVRTVKFPFDPGTPDIEEDPNAPQTPEDGNR